MSGIISGLIAAVIMVLWYRSRAGRAGVAFAKDDPRLLAAKDEARASLPAFWAAIEAAAPGDENFALKFNLLHGRGSADDASNRESIWAGDIARREGRIFGRLLNEPLSPGFKQGEVVEIAPDAIDDWSFFRAGVAQGHHVTRVMIETAPASTVRHQKQALGWV